MAKHRVVRAGHDFKPLRESEIKHDFADLARAMEAEDQGVKRPVKALIRRILDAGGVDTDFLKLRQAYRSTAFGDLLRDTYENLSGGERATQRMIKAVSIARMPETSKVFQNVLLDVLNRGLDRRSRLEDAIVAESTIRTGERVYARMMDVVFRGEPAPAYDEVELFRKGYGAIRLYDLRSGQHDHAQPHFHRVLQLVGDIIGMQDRRVKRRIDNAIESRDKVVGGKIRKHGFEVVAEAVVKALDETIPLAGRRK